MYQLAQHASVLSAQTVLEQLESNPELGLTNDNAAQRSKESGWNELPPPARPHPLKIYVHQLLSPLIFLLVAAAAIAYFLGEVRDAIIILLVVALNSVIGFVQEWRAENKMAALKKYLTPMAKVMRDGHLEHIPAKNLTIGDIMILEAGDRVPADGRLLLANQLAINESSFTGEAEPATKTAATIKTLPTLAERHNMVLMGSLVSRGNGRAVVTAIGHHTELGTISSLVESAGPQASPLQKTIAQLSRQLLVVAAFTMIMVLLFGLRAHLSWVYSIQTAISLAVSAVPEGLPVVVTVTLSLGLWRLAKQKSIIRHLDAVETLGSVDVICTDKTGTLTRGEMMVDQIELISKTLTVTGNGFEPVGQLLLKRKPIGLSQHPDVRAALEAAMLSTTSRVALTSQGTYQPIGDPTEVALYVLAKKSGLSRKQLLQHYRPVFELPFDQSRRLSSFVYQVGSQFLWIVKGAPEVVGELLPRQRRTKLLAAARTQAHQGSRVITIGWKVLATNPAAKLNRDLKHWPELQTGVNVSMHDGLRTDSFTALAESRAAGIKVMMVTGDHLLTAQHIGHDLGFSSHQAMLGAEADELSDTQLTGRLEDITIFARATSDFKMRLVRLLQKQGLVVAMTGDGVNDAPALKQADVGVAMGRTGSDVAVSVADVVLTEDNFSSLVAAIKEGRIIWLNLRKVIFYLLSTSIAEIALITAALAAGLPLPLLPTQILWINLITDGFLDMGLATEKAEADVMAQPPRGRTPLIDVPLRWRVLLIGSSMSLIGLAAYWASHWAEPAIAQTMTLLNMAALQWVNAWNARSERTPVWRMNPLGNRALVGSLLICITLQGLAMYWPPLQYLLHTTALSAQQVLLAVTPAVLILAVDGGWKWWQNRREHPQKA